MPKIPGLIALRAAGLFCVLLAANTVMLMMLYKDHFASMVAPRQAAVVAAEIRHIRSDIELMPRDVQDRWMAQFKANSLITLERLPDVRHIVDYPLDSKYLRVSEEVIRRDAGNDVRLGVRQTPELPIYFIEFDAIGERFRLSFPGLGLATSKIWPITWLLASNGLIVLVVVFFVIEQISRPLRRTSAALQQHPDKLVEIEMPVSASDEFMIIARRFNDLVSRVKAQERERQVLLAGVSHDLRAPLTRIRTNAELVDDANPGSGGRILRDCDSMRHIIDQFLDYQRGVNPRLSRPTDIRQLVASIVELQRDIGCDVHLMAGATATLTLDPSAIERILNNLIDNSTTYGEGCIEVRVDVDEAAVTISVRDHGPGIHEAAVERLLQPFERHDQARAQFGHCGLGLSIVDRLVRQLHGTLRLANHPDGGLVVSFSLPAVHLKAH